MPCKWIGCMHKGQVRKRWSPRETAHKYDPEDKSCNARRPNYNMQLQSNSGRNQPKQIAYLLSSKLDYPERRRGQDNS